MQLRMTDAAKNLRIKRRLILRVADVMQFERFKRCIAGSDKRHGSELLDERQD
jgi:hypothetical protein